MILGLRWRRRGEERRRRRRNPHFTPKNAKQEERGIGLLQNAGDP
jgi:hypothetical protein